jgi:long-chain fatty acid transport protein
MPWTSIAHKITSIAIVAMGFVVANTTTAQAGGFAIREQSTSGLGAAFAGVAAGYDLSSIFWNPAGVSVAQGIEAEADGSLIVPNSHITGTASLEPLFGPSVPLSFLDSNSGELAEPAFIPAMYAGMPLNDRLSVGFGFNGPFGLTTEPNNDNWAGKFEARTSMLRTYDFNPVASYRVTPNLVVGAGVQIEFANAALKSAFPGIGLLEGPNPDLVIKGNDFGFGYTTGLLWRPLSGTDIGLGFRSSIENTLEGDIFVAGVHALGSARTSVDLQTPEIATASVRQKVSERVTLLGTLEWTNWSVLDQVSVKAHTSDPQLGAVAGGIVTVLPLHWNDGWFFSGGAEFEVNDRTTLRAGVGFEESPIQNATERTARVPDTNRTWVSVGATHKFSAMSVNLAYSHVFFEDGSVDRVSEIPGLGQVRLLGEAQQDVDIVSVSFKVKLGNPPMANPMK